MHWKDWDKPVQFVDRHGFVQTKLWIPAGKSYRKETAQIRRSKGDYWGMIFIIYYYDFSFPCEKHLWVLVRIASFRWFLKVPTRSFYEEKWRIISSWDVTYAYLALWKLLLCVSPYILKANRFTATLLPLFFKKRILIHTEEVFFCCCCFPWTLNMPYDGAILKRKIFLA